MNRFCPRRINIPEQIRYYKRKYLVAPGVVVTEQFVFYWCPEKVEVNGESVFGISTKALFMLT
jgi:hypothetical protein